MLQTETIPINQRSVQVTLSFSKIEEYKAISSFIPYGSVLVGCDCSGEVVSDEYIVFWNQKNSKYNEIVFSEAASEPYMDEFTIDVGKFSNDIQEIYVFSSLFACEQFDVIATVNSDEKRICAYRIIFLR